MAKKHIVLVLALAASLGTVQADPHNWQPDKVSSLRAKTWYGVSSFVAMIASLAYHAYCGAKEQHKLHAARVRAQAAREDRVLTVEEKAAVGSWTSKLSLKGTLKSIAGGLTLKSGMVGNIASWMLLLTVVERLQWGLKEKGQAGPSWLTRQRAKSGWKWFAWGGMSVSVLMQMVHAAHATRDVERARLEALAEKEGRALTSEELDSVANAIDFSAQNTGKFVKQWGKNLKKGVLGQGNILESISTWFPLIATAERIQWAYKTK